MPEFLRFVEPNFRSLIWHITESVDHLLEQIPLSEGELVCFSQFKTEQRKKQWLAYRRALMSLNESVHIPIDYTEIGKPVYSDCSAHISVSHSGSYAQAIIGDKMRRVGVDIEVASDTAHRVRTKFMGLDEINFAETVDAKQVSLLTWCAKEAMYKAMGREGVIFAQHMKLYGFNFEDLTARGFYDFENVRTCFDLRFFQNIDFVSAMCCENI